LSQANWSLIGSAPRGIGAQKPSICRWFTRGA